MIKQRLKSLVVKCRCILGSLRGAKICVGKNTYIAGGSFFSSGREISIGSDSYIGRNVSLSCHVQIGNKVLVASNVAFVGGDHKIDNIEGSMIDAGRDIIKPIIVEDNVWIGHGAIILHGVRLSQGCVIGAGSVVSKDVGENEIVGGNPAKLIRYRKENI